MTNAKIMWCLSMLCGLSLSATDMRMYVCKSGTSKITLQQFVTDGEQENVLRVKTNGKKLALETVQVVDDKKNITVKAKGLNESIAFSIAVPTGTGAKTERGMIDYETVTPTTLVVTTTAGETQYDSLCEIYDFTEDFFATLFDGFI